MPVVMLFCAGNQYTVDKGKLVELHGVPRVEEKISVTGTKGRMILAVKDVVWEVGGSVVIMLERTGWAATSIGDVVLDECGWGTVGAAAT